MSGRPWYPHYINDYARDTAHLSMIEHGAYRLLLDHYYTTGKPLPANAEHLHRICRATTPQEIDAVDMVLRTFFRLSRSLFIHKRADSEIRKADAISLTRGNAARKRHQIASANADQLHTHTQSHTQTHKKEESISSVPASKRISKNPLNGHQEDFAAFYAAFPKHVSRAQAAKAYATALGKTDPATLFGGAQRYAMARAREDPKYTKNPATWLNSECWADETPMESGAQIDSLLKRIQDLANA